MDDTLYLEGVPDELQPGLFLRRVNGKALNDEEMIEYYTSLVKKYGVCLLYTSPSPRDLRLSRMPSSA